MDSGCKKGCMICVGQKKNNTNVALKKNGKAAVISLCRVEKVRAGFLDVVRTCDEKTSTSKEDCCGKKDC